MSNNDFPLALIDKIILNTTNKLIEPTENPEENEPKKIKFFVNLTNLNSFKNDEKHLKQIFKMHLKPTNQIAKIKLTAYFRPCKLSTKFSTRPQREEKKKSNVVYQFTCPEDGCQATYVGYTTNSLSQRASQHRFKPSKIFEHLRSDHNIASIPNLSDHFKIIHQNQSLIELRMAESILIKILNPLYYR